MLLESIRHRLGQLFLENGLFIMTLGIGSNV